MLLAAVLTDDQVRERAAEVLGRGGYQRELPKEVTPFTFDLPALGGLGKLLTVLAWAGAAVLVALALVWVARRLRPPVRDAAVGDDAAAAAPDIPIVGAEAFATAGLYGEAIHALLLETLQALSRAARLPRSYTSREIVARVPLRAAAREALADLVAAVEISRFGGATPTEADYRGCLARFHAFLASYQGAP